MNVSHETIAQTTARLRRVMARAEWKVYEGTFAFREHPVTEGIPSSAASALALVRDEEVWSSLVACAEPGVELFTVFSFHFVAGLDNSGFVGWLAGHLKAVLGTGVLVVCGQNSARGGIFDYWGVPAELGAAATAEIERLRAEAVPQ